MPRPALLALVAAAAIGSVAATSPAAAQDQPRAIPGVSRLGPDGVVYPDFTDAGVRGGIPAVEGPVFNVTDFGANGADDQPDEKAIRATVASCIAKGGGVVYFPDGTYQLDGGVMVQNAGSVVFRGESRDGVVLKLNGDDEGVGAAIRFRADRRDNRRELAQPVAPGERRFVLRELKAGFAPGDKVIYESDRHFYIYEVEAVDGDAVVMRKPANVALSPEDRIYGNPANFRRLRPAERVGVEDLTIETTREMDTHGVTFDYTWDGWVKNVSILKAGRRPIEFYRSAHITVRDCLYTATWKAGSGGVGYGGFFVAFDCLMDNVESRDLRHAPNLQDVASGCVIRNSRFFQSDLQWHTGGPHHNLIENCLIELDDSKPGLSGASHVARTSRPAMDTVHSAVGPANVLWHGDFRGHAKNSALDLGWYVHGWVIAYNRFDVEGGGDPFVRIWKDCARNLTFIGNAFACQKHDNGGVTFTRKDAGTDPGDRGVAFIDNSFYGVQLTGGQWWRGEHGADGPDVLRDNTVHEQYQTPPMPTPPLDADGKPIDSLYAWQLQQKQSTAGH